MHVVAGTIFDDLVAPANLPNLLKETRNICALLKQLPVVPQEAGQRFAMPCLVVIDWEHEEGDYASGNSERASACSPKDFSGILQADGYVGFAQLYATGTIQDAACWAHARRNFYDLYKDLASPLTAEARQRIAALYAIECEIRGQPPDQRRAVRQSRASPLLELLHLWLNQTLTQLSKKSALGGAILYALNRWQALRSDRDRQQCRRTRVVRRSVGSQKLPVCRF
jgi:hypothetical protein